MIQGLGLKYHRGLELSRREGGWALEPRAAGNGREAFYAITLESNAFALGSAEKTLKEDESFYMRINY